MKDTNLITLVENKRLQPFTMFWPSDEALNSLSAERKTWLYSEDHRDKLEAFLKAHMVRDTSVSNEHFIHVQFSSIELSLYSACNTRSW